MAKLPDPLARQQQQRHLATHNIFVIFFPMAYQSFNFGKLLPALPLPSPPSPSPPRPANTPQQLQSYFLQKNFVYSKFSGEMEAWKKNNRRKSNPFSQSVRPKSSKYKDEIKKQEKKPRTPLKHPSCCFPSAATAEADADSDYFR